MNELPPGKSGRSALEVAITAAKEAGEILLAHFGATRRIKHKSKGNLVTDVDILSEELVLKLLKDEYPDYNVLSEESKFSSPIAGHTWIVDPLDGTNNYAYGIPFFCINIALVVDKDILLGVTYDPVRGELFQAQKGQGACLNGSVICIPKVDTLQTSLVGLDLGYDE
ncbi:MAG TPA: inositol monophosphatase, partial [Dehalococcoidia bacterium]|nr:inositol monophosphatase [Dehalococcoidia bacterium]